LVAASLTKVETLGVSVGGHEVVELAQVLAGAAVVGYGSVGGDYSITDNGGDEDTVAVFVDGDGMQGGDGAVFVTDLGTVK
jgi:hypothetical protein